ncbi:TetR/AcrR family transcriptional regulator [Pantoea sp. EA-12]|uniref:TetR/AcrR family transcriptional regulator n=1 Tax=Pantoea sp. EA-12 TaxID=3043303 RepID=UPI0024B59EEB|nr:TetR/AcrR family transcriptional regulator [Pantoea sp. EA-12]MDI9222414.1 TetR/AcrR family transcriptional regulator [Pantoea sp. EA-12]
MNRSEQILDAAEQCMRQKGFHQTSIQNIASQADVSIGLIYKYYTNKEAIIEALVTHVVQRMITMLNADFEQIAHAGGMTHSANDIIPAEVENSIVLLMEVSSEATRNTRIRQIMNDAWQILKNNFITQEQALNPGLDANKIHTRLYIMSLVIDGIIIRRCMKQRAVPASFMSFFDTIANDVNQHSIA